MGTRAMGTRATVRVCACVCTVPAALTLFKPLGRFSISSLVLSMLRPLQGDQRP